MPHFPFKEPGAGRHLGDTARPAAVRGGSLPSGAMAKRRERRERTVGVVLALAWLATLAGCSSDPAQGASDKAGEAGGGSEAAEDTGSTLDRPVDPVVVAGADVEALVGAPPDRIVAFRAADDGWEQIPVQVDERLATTIQAAYDLPAGQFGSSTDIPVTLYADPHTFVGADPDATLDADDEIA